MSKGKAAGNRLNTYNSPSKVINFAVLCCCVENYALLLQHGITFQSLMASWKKASYWLTLLLKQDEFVWSLLIVAHLLYSWQNSCSAIALVVTSSNHSVSPFYSETSALALKCGSQICRWAFLWTISRSKHIRFPVVPQMRCKVFLNDLVQDWAWTASEGDTRHHKKTCVICLL